MSWLQYSASFTPPNQEQTMAMLQTISLTLSDTQAQLLCTNNMKTMINDLQSSKVAWKILQE